MSRTFAPLCVLAFLVRASSAAAQDQRALLELIVNRVPSGETLVVLRGDDALVSVKSLQDAGIREISGTRDVIGSLEFVSLSSLAPDITFLVDAVELRLTLTVSPGLLGVSVYDLASRAPRDLIYRKDSSGFVNYSANWHSNRQFDLFVESAASLGGASIYSTMSANARSTTRGLTSVTVDQRQSLRRWTAGDSFAYTGPLGGGVWIAGLTVTKEFAIDPYFTRYPTLSVATPIAVPSVMEVYVNGQNVRQEQVAPGRLDVSNLPLIAGRNDARVVIRDAFGQTRELSSTYYLATTTLARGLHDYQYSVGVSRTGIGESSWNYHRPVMLARHRVGVTDWFTAGGRVEVEPGAIVSGGPSVNMRLPFGEIETSAAVSRRSGLWGHAASAAFTYTGRPISAGGAVTFASPEYSTVTPAAVNEALAWQGRLFASATLSRAVSMTLQQTQTILQTGVSRQRTGVSGSIRVGRFTELLASLARASDERGTSDEIYAGVAVLFGHSSVSLARLHDSRGSRVSIEAQRPLPVGVGYGYQLHAEDGPSGSLNGVASYQGSHGRYELRQESLGSESITTASVFGSLVSIGGRVFATRPVDESFALVRVPGVAGVRAFASHQEIGRTGRHGDLLVPNLHAYYGNILDIADADIPLHYDVGGAAMTLAPPYRGGAVAVFDVRPVRHVLGKIVTAGEERPFAYGELTASDTTGRTYLSPVGGDGSFYFENLPTGAYTAVVVARGSECRLTIQIPSSTDSVIKLGTLRCMLTVAP